jgi:hypothetical protein
LRQLILTDITSFGDRGLILAMAKQVLAGLQQEIVTAVRSHTVRRPDCRRCHGVCYVKDHRQR